MKKGFTMIELIFVIVILGILAAVAVPRLTATRDDAEIAKAATNLTTLIGDISSYYTSQAGFATKISGMTNVQLDTEAGDPSTTAGATAYLLAAGKKCLKVTLKPIDTATDKPATLKVEKTNSSEQTGKENSTDLEAICSKIHNNKGVADVLASTFTYTKKTAGNPPTYASTTSDPGEIAISGTGVKF